MLTSPAAQTSLTITLIGATIADLDTPSLIVDLDRLDANIAAMSALIQERGVAWRPHAKAHKCPAIAHRLLAAGAIGITCAKLGEAEVFAAAGIRDILIANQIVGPIKTRRLAALCREADVIVAIDSLANAREIDRAAAEFGSRPRIVIELNCGMNRAGIEPGEPAVTLARAIDDLPNVRFAGLMSWEGQAAGMAKADARRAEITRAVGQVVVTAAQCRAAGLPVDIVSCGGTATFLTTTGIAGVTEVQAGGGIFGDTFYRNHDVPVQPALSVLAQVTSRPAPDRIIIDAGRKAVDPANLAPDVWDLPGVRGIAFSAEHGTIALDHPSDTPAIGDKLRLGIGYSDQAVHLHECLIGVRNNRVEAVWPIAARGKLQ